jgi:exopolysaccharide production protein ExoZ
VKLGSVQFLRAVAAVLVGYAHSIDLQMSFSHSFQQDFLYLQNFGAFGVDIFFVISGFIISYSASRYMGGKEGLTFLIHRFKRVNPVYYLATLLFLLIPLYQWLSHRTAIPPTHAEISKSIYVLPLRDRWHWSTPILLQAWTLAFEWMFYLFFLAAIILRVRRKEMFLMALSLFLIIAGSFLTSRSDFRLRFITNPIIAEFMLGVGIYACYRKIKITRVQSYGLLGAGIAICLYEIIKGFGDISEANYTVDGSGSLQRCVIWGIPAALLVAGCVFLEKNGGLAFSRNRWISLIGDSSYSFYLIHTTIYRLFTSLYIRRGFFRYPDLAIFLQLGCAIAGGILFYKLVEAPLLRRLYSSSTTRDK